MIRKTKEEQAEEVEVMLYKLGKYWKARPWLRLGQIMSNAWGLCDAYKQSPEPEVSDLYYIENDKLVAAIDQLEKQEGK